MMKRLFASILAGATVLSLAACGAAAPQSAAVAEKMNAALNDTVTISDTAVYEAPKSPKYVFLFIGDGMS
ncbi:MAG: alkaline phosphatase, partial [Dysosmobacter sp.]|nr:alkaline phosphatase [Dysosmobacter sp.]